MTQAAQDQSVYLKDVSFAWPGRTTFSLHVPDFSVARGEKLFLLGSSGSGKSTLLSLICGISQPQSGAVFVDGTDLSKMTGAKRDRFRADTIGVIFQMFNLLPYTSPLENVLLPLAFSTTRRQAVSDPKSEALRLTRALGLDDDLVTRARAAELSIGQQQRIAAARALIGSPNLIVADEPTSSLDADAQSAFVDLLMEQVDEAGATLLMVSHDARLANRFDTVADLTEIATTSRSAA